MSNPVNQHYVPCAYLKNWIAADGHLYSYRTLVSHSGVPLWKRSSPRGVAYHWNLYTRIVEGRESHDVEKWLDHEIERPAEDALQKAISGTRLAPSDWRRLVRFLAAQDVRTPTRFRESQQRWDTTLPRLLEDVVKKSIEELELHDRLGEPLPQSPRSRGNELPMRVRTEVIPGQAFGKLEARILAGRSLWLFEIRHAIEKTAEILNQHRWTILSPPEDLLWFTSDTPVVRLNFYGIGHYDLKGGWGVEKTDIFLPLGPRHLLYTQVGDKRPPTRGERCPLDQAIAFRRFIAKNADQIIISVQTDVDVPTLRPRIVDAGAFRAERESWRKWHEEQSSAEMELMTCD